MRILACILVGLVTQHATAQTSETTEPDTTASIIPVGSNSDAYWVGDGPGMRAIPIDPGAAPPSTLAFRIRDELVKVPTILNRPSLTMPVREGSLSIFASMTPGADEELPLFASFTIPPAPGHYDIYLTRAAKRKDWQDPAALVVPSTTTSFPAGSVRLINLDAQPVRAQVGTSTVDLLPGKVRVVPADSLRSESLVPLRAANPSDEGPRWIMKSAIRHQKPSRTNVIFYPSRKPKSASKVTYYEQFKPESIDPKPPEP